MTQKFLLPGLFLALAACQNRSTDSNATNAADMDAPTISQQPFGQADSQQVQLYTLRNAQGMTVKISTYGGIITEWTAPDKNGTYEDVVLGFPALADYQQDSPYFGALVGRYGNRIGRGRFTLNGRAYRLATNNGANHLHGGLKGFDKQVWAAEQIGTDSTTGLILRYTSPDGEEGYPGRLTTEVTYTLGNDNALRIDYRATTDKPTVVNLTNHTYFNLSGNARRNVLDQLVQLKASRFVPIDNGLIPTGKLDSVGGTPFDFRSLKPIGQEIDAQHEQLRRGKGYDHCWVFDRSGPGLELLGRAEDPASGRVLELLTTEPAVQFYSGNFLDGKLTGKGNVQYEQRYGFCLETQHYPDSPNRPAFPSTVLEPGQTYQSTTVYRFSVKK